MNGLELVQKEGEQGGEAQLFNAADHPVARATWYYKEDLDAIAIDHVMVLREEQGKGIGTRLMDELVDMIRQKKKKLYPECLFAKEYVSGKEKQLSDILI